MCHDRDSFFFISEEESIMPLVSTHHGYNKCNEHLFLLWSIRSVVSSVLFAAWNVNVQFQIYCTIKEKIIAHSRFRR